MASSTQTAALHPQGLALTGPNGETRGWVDFKTDRGLPVLEDLWVMQGSLCDLRCTHCYVASSPTNDRLQQIRFDELRPHLDEAARFGVARIYFTGGEVFVNEDVLRGRADRNEEFLASLGYALEIAPVEILTNGRRYLRNHLDALCRLRSRHGDRLQLRVSLESPRAAEHDAIRGRTTHEQTLETLQHLTAAGFEPIVTAERPLLSSAGDEAIRGEFEAVFGANRVRARVNLIENVMEMGHQLVQIEKEGRQPAPATFVTTNCFDILGTPPESLMCHSSRCIQKIEGRLRYYPCPVIYDDPSFDLGGTLAESVRRVYVAHKNCYDYCMKGAGATCRTQIL